jgi:DNA polymerase-4
VAKLERMGIADLATLREYDQAALEAAFGPRMGGWLRSRARFEDETPIAVSHRTKSQSTETTFDTDVDDPERLAESLRGLAEELCRRLGSRALKGRTIGIKVRLDDWTTVTRSHTVEDATNDPAVVVATALDLLRAYAPPRPVRLLGVRVAGFDDDADGTEADEAADADTGQLRLGVAG